MQSSIFYFRKTFTRHFFVTIIIYILFLFFFSSVLYQSEKINPRTHRKEIRVTGAYSREYETQIGGLVIEKIELQGAGSGESGGCAKQLYVGEERRFLGGVEYGCNNLYGKNMLLWAATFYTIVFVVPIALPISAILFLLGRKLQKPWLITLSLIPLDVLFFIALAICIPVPTFTFSAPFHYWSG